MTYIELAVVLSIFAIISSVSIFNYREFQIRVNLKKVASDIAFKITEAQKSALSGKLSPPLPWEQPPSSPLWKPSYGVFFNLQDVPPNTGDKIFYFYTDLNQSGYFNDADPAVSPPCDQECLEKITISNGVRIYDIIDQNETISLRNSPTIHNLHINFTRPNSGASFSAMPSGGQWNSATSIDIILTADGLPTPTSPNFNEGVIIHVWPSGRIEIE